MRCPSHQEGAGREADVAMDGGVERFEIAGELDRAAVEALELDLRRLAKR